MAGHAKVGKTGTKGGHGRTMGVRRVNGECGVFILYATADKSTHSDDGLASDRADTKESDYLLARPMLLVACSMTVQGVLILGPRKSRRTGLGTAGFDEGHLTGMTTNCGWGDSWFG